MTCCYRTLQFLSSILLAIILGLTIAAGASNTWWKFAHLKQGLWQHDGNNHRDDLFHFSANKNYDIVLLALIVCAACVVMTLIMSIVSACQKYPSKCLILIEAIVTLFATLSIGFGILWALLKITLENTGYAFYLAYGSVGACLITLCLLVSLLCMQSPSPYRSTNRDDEIAMLRR